MRDQAPAANTRPAVTTPAVTACVFHPKRAAVTGNLCAPCDEARLDASS